MATSQKDTIPICDVGILTTKRVKLVKEIILENVMPSVKPFLLYTQVDAINAERGRDEKIRSMLDIIQRQVNVNEYRAFISFILSLAGTQPELFKEVCGREPTVTESDFCMKEISQEMKTTIDSSKHCTDSKLDEQIDFQYEYVELAMVDKAAEKQQLASQGGKLPHEYRFHLDKANSGDRNISPCDVLDNEDRPHKKVSIYGRAGVGKSTTMQFMAKKWAQGRWATGFTILFLLQVRLIITQLVAISTVELLQLYGLYDFPDQSDSSPFTSWLKNSASRILILIDGLDEIPGFAERMMNTPRICDILQKAHPIDLCINILRGDLLPGCTVVSASRPFAGLSELRTDAKAEILGLTTAKVTKFVEHRHPDHVKDILSVLSRNPILLSACSITFYCMMITRLLSEGVIIQDEEIKTYTRLMSFIIIQYCSRKINDSSFQMNVTSYFSKLAMLAYSGIFEIEDNKGIAKVIFDEDDLIRSNITPQDLENMKKAGIIQVSRKKIGRHELWIAEFFHLSAQELLAVAHFLSHPPFPNDTLHQLFHSGQFNLALQFIFGLHFDRNNCWTSKICKSVNTQIKSEGIEHKLSTFIDSIVDQKLKMCQLIHEGQWEKKAKEIVHHIAPGRKLVMERTTMTAIDLLALDFVCQLETLGSITLMGVHADDTFLSVLADGLQRNTALIELNLCDNEIGDKGAASLGAILSHNTSLQKLDICRNQIGDVGAQAIATGLICNTSLKVLKISAQGEKGKRCLGDAGAIALADIPLDISLVELDISQNHIGDAGAIAIAKKLQTNTRLVELNMSVNKICASGAIAIADMLPIKTQLVALKISHNDIGDTEAVAIAHMLSEKTHLAELNISNDDIGDTGSIAISDMISNETHLVELNISHNDIGEPGAVAIAYMLPINTHLVELKMSDNRIGDAGVVAIAGAFRSTAADTGWIWCGCLPSCCTWHTGGQYQCNTMRDAETDATQSPEHARLVRQHQNGYNTTLKLLSLRANSQGSEGEKALTNVTKYNPDLIILH